MTVAHQWVAMPEVMGIAEFIIGAHPRDPQAQPILHKAINTSR